MQFLYFFAFLKQIRCSVLSLSMLSFSGKFANHPRYLNKHIFGDGHKRAFAVYQKNRLQAIADSADAAAREPSQAIEAAHAHSAHNSHASMYPNTTAAPTLPFPLMQPLPPLPPPNTLPPAPLPPHETLLSPPANVPCQLPGSAPPQPIELVPQPLPTAAPPLTLPEIVTETAIVPYQAAAAPCGQITATAQSSRQCCQGAFLELVSHTAVGSVADAIDVWMANGQIAYKQSASLRLIYTLSDSKVHVRSKVCFNSGVMLVSREGICCHLCMKQFEDTKIASDLVSLAYLVQKGKLLEADASCVCFL